MGWLMEKAAGQRMPSMGAVAARMWGKPGCATAGPLKQASLANNLRKLEKGGLTEWWLGGPGSGYLPFLAAVLKVEPAVLEAEIHAARALNEDDERFFHFEVFPRLLAIDLDAEDPYPGVPSELLEGDGPERRTWWRATPGSGRTLVGRWLARRHGWTFGSTAGTKCFIEFDGMTEPPARPRRLVIASPRPMPGELASRWTAVETPVDWADTLLAWIGERVGPGGQFDREQFAAWVRQHPGQIESPGRMIELAAAMDDRGTAGLEQPDPRAALSAWVGTHAGRKDRVVGPASRAFLRTQGCSVLIDTELNRRVRGLSVSREHVALCLPKCPPAPDADAVVEALERGGAEAVREVVRPQAPAVIQAMQELRWLLPGEWGFPSRVAQLLAACVVEHATTLPLTDIGRLLDHDDLVLPLLSRLAETDTLAAYLAQVDDLDLDDPAAVLAVDGLNKAATLCVARGGRLPDSGVVTLRSATLAAAGASRSLPLRVGRRAAVDEAAWQALCALTLGPPSAVEERASAERWRLAGLVEKGLVLKSDGDAVARALQALALSKIAEILDEEPLVGADLVLSAARDLFRGSPGAAGRADVVADLGPLGVLDSLVKRWGGTWEAVAPLLWPGWLKRLDSPPWEAPGSAADCAILTRVWRLVPAEDLGRGHVQAAVGQAASGVQVPCAVWQHVVPLASAQGLREMAERLPLEVVREVADSESGLGAARWAESVLWARLPGDQLAAVVGLVHSTSGAGRLVRLLSTVPESALLTLLGELERRCTPTVDAQVQSVLDEWLGHVMARVIAGEREHRDVAYRVWRRGNPGGEPETSRFPGESGGSTPSTG